MIPPRRALPSLTALYALDALDRLGSATAAAAELNLTQSAISRQLQGLEAQLGAELIRRERQRMYLTEPARAYLAELRPALHQIARAALRLQVPQTGGQVMLAILPTFGMQWLLPRLPRFAALHPQITVNMTTRLSRFNFAAEGIDAAIHYGDADWPGTGALLLKRESVLPVCSTALLDQSSVARPADLAALPLLHIQTRPRAWAEWFAHWGAEAPAPTGMLHDQFSTIIQAARHGLGVALLPDYLAAQEIASGALVPAWGSETPSKGAYWLIWPEDKADNPALGAFRNWLESEAETEDTLPR